MGIEEADVQQTEHEEIEVTEEETVESGESEDVQDEESEVVVEIEGVSPPPEEEKAPEWVRDLRKSHRELQRKNRELEEKLKTGPAEVKPVVLGQKPTLEGSDFDTDTYEKELTAWYERKRDADDQEAKAREDQKNQETAWNQRLETYSATKVALKAKDFDDVEHVAKEVLSVTQQGIILHGSDNSALVVYALGQNPTKLKEIAAITDPVKFAFAIAKLETQMKVTSRKSAPKPETVVKGNGASAGLGAATLDKLRAEAEKSGDYSKVLAYKKANAK
jgi:hypothetical protein